MPSLIWPSLAATAPGQVALDRAQRRREAPDAAYRIHWRWAAWKGLGLEPGGRRAASDPGRQQQVAGRSGLGGKHTAMRGRYRTAGGERLRPGFRDHARQGHCIDCRRLTLVARPGG